MVVLTDSRLAARTDSAISMRLSSLTSPTITVRPAGVTVVAPWFVRNRAIEALVASKRDWIERKTSAQRLHKPRAMPERFVDGARVRFRGRFLPLSVEPVEGSDATLRFASAFLVRVSASANLRDREQTARRLVTEWLKRRALDDVRAWCKRYGAGANLRPARIRIGDQKTLWGSCSPRGTISINWRLVAAPRRVFEYVVVHELCHLEERNHSPKFWSLVESLLPDYRERREWLKTNGIALG